jgi:hypothetical protein
MEWAELFIDHRAKWLFFQAFSLFGPVGTVGTDRIKNLLKPHCIRTRQARRVDQRAAVRRVCPAAPRSGGAFLASLRAHQVIGLDAQRIRVVTRMYGAAVRCKRFSSICRLWVLHQCIRPRVGAVVLRAIMDISARAFSLPARPQVGHSGHQGSHVPGRPVLHFVSSSRRPRRETVVLRHHGLLIGAVPLFVS